MKKSLLPLFLICMSFFSVEGASRYNENQDVNSFVQIDHFILREVRAHRAVTSGNIWDKVVNEEEDHWKIWYHFTVDVTNFELRWKALDGTNDNDQREYTDKYSSREGGKEYNKKHTNFPTYVDNMQIDIKYDYQGITYEYRFFIYTETPDQGSAPLLINTELIPQNATDSDGSGIWGTDTGIGGKLSGIWEMVKIPYNFIKWLADINTYIALWFGSTICIVSFWAMIKVPIGISGWLFIPFLLGIMIMLTTLLEAIGIVGGFTIFKKRKDPTIHVNR